jgi:hypothetical protein
MRLRPEISYTNEVFQNRLFGPRIVREVRPFLDLEQGEALYLDNPFTGFSEGMYNGTQIRRVPSGEPDDAFPWVQLPPKEAPKPAIYGGI